MVNGKGRKKVINKKLKGKGQTRSRGATRSRGTRVLAQGAAGVTRRAFGGTAVKSIPRGLPAGCWNASATPHAGLPRAVGPYTVVRTTTMITSKSPLLIFGSYATQWYGQDPMTQMLMGSGYGTKLWSNVCCVGAAEDIAVSDFAASSIPSGTHTEVHAIPIPGTTGNGVFASNVGAGETPVFTVSKSTLTCVPSAISVQIINPTPVQTAAGTGIAAVCPVRLDLQGTSKTWSTVGTELLSYYRPRVLTGGKLALRGVQMDSLPLSMTDVSDFRETYQVDPLACHPSSLVWSASGSAQNIVDAPALSTIQKSFLMDIQPEGWAPLVYYSPFNAAREAADRQEMTFLVTFEWRTRFDISNPASSSHSLHTPSTDIQWHNHIRAATNALPGVIDIVEKVANTGMALYKAAALL